MEHCLTLLLSTAVLLSACLPALGASCGTSDLRAYGVVADGVTDDSPFLQNASATATAPGLYLERAKGSTDLTIKTDVTLTKPLLLGRKISLQIAAGRTLTLTAQLMAPRVPLLLGTGKLKFSGPGPFLVLNEWFKWESDDAIGSPDDSPAMLRIAEACADAICTIIHTWPAWLSQPWPLTPNVGVWAGASANLLAAGTGPVGDPPTTITAYDFQPGDYSATPPYELAFAMNFGTTLRARGTTGLQAYLVGAKNGAAGVLLQGSVEKTAITVHTMQFINTAFALAADALKKVTLWTFHFVDYPKTGRSVVTDFRTVPTTAAGTQIIFRSINGHDKTNANVALLQNTAGPSPVPPFRWSITSWGGGVAPGISIVSGAFTRLQAWARMTTAELAFAGFTGADNTLNYAGLYLLETIPLGTSAENAPQVYRNFAVVGLPDGTAAWPAGVSRNYYVAHTMMGGGKQTRMVMSPGPTSRAALGNDWVNPGLVITKLLDVSTASRPMLRVTIKNISSKEWDASFKLDWRLMVAVPGIGK